MKRLPRNLIEREAARRRAVAELRHHDPYGPPELVFAREAMLIRLLAAR